ncbi:MAG: peptidoglycan recognition family protein [Sedimentisphaerales bacterium]
MRRLVWLLLGAGVFIFSGCGQEERGPEIVYDNYPPPPVPPRTAPLPSQPRPIMPLPGNVPSSWMPTHTERAWSAIIIHHSATTEGNATIIDKWHRENNGWNGVGYDFVIGNGTNSGDGEVEPTYRWRGQLTGAHCGGTPGNWANEEGIGICLIGDFDHSAPTSRQMESLAKLIRFLQQRYHIPKSRVFGHGSVPGGHVTDCPGKRFPWNWLRANISY